MFYGAASGLASGAAELDVGFGMGLHCEVARSQGALCRVSAGVRTAVLGSCL